MPVGYEPHLLAGFVVSCLLGLLLLTGPQHACLRLRNNTAFQEIIRAWGPTRFEPSIHLSCERWHTGCQTAVLGVANTLMGLSKLSVVFTYARVGVGEMWLKHVFGARQCLAGAGFIPQPTSYAACRGTAMSSIISIYDSVRILAE